MFFGRILLSATKVYVMLASALVAPTSLSGGESWSIPLAGNAYRTAPSPVGDGFQRNRGIRWSDRDAVYSIYFRIDRPAPLKLALRARAPEGRSRISVRSGDRTFEVAIEGTDLESHPIGELEVAQAGYVRVDLQGRERSGAVFAEVEQLIVTSDTENLSLDYVKNNEGNMFYWGRRGPSVHLGYEVPRDRPLQYAYSELTIPEGQDPIGSYFMANGFGEGYFGIQVNSPTERRVLFSVWSPFQTDNPREIPEEQRIVAVGKGPEVRIGEFGNEGSGGQSFLVYPWKAGRTYRFLTEVTPDGKGSTVYRCWFGDKAAGEWRLIAGFRRPKTDTTLRGFHSFLESFHPEYGFVGRRVLYSNVWVREVSGAWHECTTARFSVDPTGGGRHRRDFAGGSEGSSFFLRNCGFFNDTTEAGTKFTRESSGVTPPDIDFEALPK